MPSTSALVSASLAFAVLAAVLGAYGFHGRAVVVGVDLGTTFSAVAVARNRSGAVVPAAGGGKSTASILAVGAGGNFLVGEAARAAVTDDPWRAVFDAKRVIGRSLATGDPVAAAEAARHGGRLVPHPGVRRNGAGKVVVTAKAAAACAAPGARCVHDLAFVVRLPPSEAAAALPVLAADKCVDPGSVVTAGELVRFLTGPAQGYHMDAPPPVEGGGSEDDDDEDAAAAAEAPRVVPPELAVAPPDERLLLLTPQAAGCVLVRHMLASVRRALGHASIASVVAAVPADFTQPQREATLEAYRRAGVSVSRVLSEPAAAAVAYGLHRRPDVRYVLVYDMGGGTTDVSVLYAQEGAFTVIGSSGDGHLGGEDFDDCVMGLMATHVAAAGAVLDDALALAAAEVGGGGSGGRAGRQQRRSSNTAQQHGACSAGFLKHEAERIKIALSSESAAGDDAGVAWSCVGAAATADGAPVAVSGAVTRAAFHAACAPLFDRALGPVAEALTAANLDVSEVDELVLVGGSSRLPGVRARLAAHFRRTGPLLHAVDPDLAVAIGAASVVD